MADSEVSVRLKADGKGLVGEVGKAKSALDGLRDATEDAAQAATGAAAAMDQETAAANASAASVRKATTTTAGLKNATDGAAASVREAAKATGLHKAAVEADTAAVRQAAGAAAGAAGAQKKFGEESAGGAIKSGQAVKLNVQQLQSLQFQLQDIGVGLASGQSPFRVLAQQGSQIVQLFGAGTGVRGALKAVGTGIASFLTNPLNQALLVMTAVTGGVQLLTSALFKSADADKEKETRVRSLADAQKELDKIVGTSTRTLGEKLRADQLDTQEILNKAIATRQLLRAQLEARKSTAQSAASGQRGDIAALGLSGVQSEIDRQTKEIKELQQAERVFAGEISKLEIEDLLKPGAAALRNFDEGVAALDAELKAGTITIATYTLRLGELVEEREAGVKAARESAGEEKKTAKEFEQLTRKLEDFTASADPAKKRALELARALAEIDKAAKGGADPALVKSARVTVQELLKPITADDFIDKARKSATEEARILSLSNREREIATELEKLNNEAKEKGVSFTAEELRLLEGVAAVTVDAAAAAKKHAEAEREAAQEFTRIFETARENVQRSLADSFDDLLGGRISGVKSFWKSFQAIGRRAIAETLALLVFSGGSAPAGVGGVASKVSQILGIQKKDADGNPLPPLKGFAGGVQSSIGQVNELIKPITKGFGDTFKPLFNKLGGSFETVLGKGLGGSIVGSALSLFGNKGQTGAQIGGAIGSFLPIPGGSIIGSIAGKILGGLFGGTKKSAAAISTSDGELDVTSSFGKGSGREDQAIALAGTVVSGLRSIASALGGDIVDGLNLGSIGTRKKKFTFDASGQNRTKGAGVQSFDTEAEAAAAAIRAALAKGAVEGLSDAVRRALGSSSDIDKAVANAVSVQNLERLIEGVTDPFRSAFRDFERQAKERLKTARQFGFDVLQIEKINADERKKLVEAQLESATGSVKRLLDELKFGSGAEGSIIDQRNALLVEQARLQGLAANGDLSAVDRLAQISSQLLDVSKEAFGSAGLFASDRGSTTSLLEQLLADTEARIRESSEAAQKAAGTDQTAAQLGEANQSLDELVLNSQRSLTALNKIAGSISDGGSGGGGGARSFASEVFLRQSARIF